MPKPTDAGASVTEPAKNWPAADMIEAAWGIIANVSGRDGLGWAGQGAEWQEAAQRWRDAYTSQCAESRAVADVEGPSGPIRKQAEYVQRLGRANAYHPDVMKLCEMVLAAPATQEAPSTSPAGPERYAQRSTDGSSVTNEQIKTASNGADAGGTVEPCHRPAASPSAPAEPLEALERLRVAARSASNYGRHSENDDADLIRAALSVSRAPRVEAPSERAPRITEDDVRGALEEIEFHKVSGKLEGDLWIAVMASALSDRLQERLNGTPEPAEPRTLVWTCKACGHVGEPSNLGTRGIPFLACSECGGIVRREPAEPREHQFMERGTILTTSECAVCGEGPSHPVHAAEPREETKP